jgi:hypothetical protein
MLRKIIMVNENTDKNKNIREFIAMSQRNRLIL